MSTAVGGLGLWRVTLPAAERTPLSTILDDKHQMTTPRPQVADKVLDVEDTAVHACRVPGFDLFGELLASSGS